MNQAEYISIRDYVDTLFNARAEYVASRFESMQQAVDKAERQLSGRLENMNEFRGQLKDQAETLASIEKVEGLEDRIVRLEKERSRNEGSRAGVMASVSMVVAAISLILTFLRFIL